MSEHTQPATHDSPRTRMAMLAAAFLAVVCIGIATVVLPELRNEKEHDTTAGNTRDLSSVTQDSTNAR